eukprot:GEMP01088089.1.p1 GENE.GEMP01088089.1~~GEMP01088089.1.p1  ORF type:complete len:256 (+),score=48.10 GEMP01088089.1:86-853(+)
MDCRPLDPSEINFLWGCLSAGGVLDFHRVQKMMQGCGFDPSVREINDLLWHIDGQNGSVKKFPFTKFINSKMTRESMWEFMWTRPRPPKDEVSAEMDEVNDQLEKHHVMRVYDEMSQELEHINEVIYGTDEDKDLSIAEYQNQLLRWLSSVSSLGASLTLADTKGIVHQIMDAHMRKLEGGDDERNRKARETKCPGLKAKRAPTRGFSRYIICKEPGTKEPGTKMPDFLTRDLWKAVTDGKIFNELPHKTSKGVN